jgi:hypothetical protein
VMGLGGRAGRRRGWESRSAAYDGEADSAKILAASRMRVGTR